MEDAVSKSPSITIKSPNVPYIMTPKPSYSNERQSFDQTKVKSASPRQSVTSGGSKGQMNYLPLNSPLYVELLKNKSPSQTSKNFSPGKKSPAQMSVIKSPDRNINSPPYVELPKYRSASQTSKNVSPGKKSPAQVSGLKSPDRNINSPPDVEFPKYKSASQTSKYVSPGKKSPAQVSVLKSPDVNINTLPYVDLPKNKSASPISKNFSPGKKSPAQVSVLKSPDRNITVSSRDGTPKEQKRNKSPVSLKSVQVATPMIVLNPSKLEESLNEAVSSLAPKGKTISEHVDELAESIRKLSNNMENPASPMSGGNIEKIAKMSELLTSEANALRNSIKTLSKDIVDTKKQLQKDVNFPYHLFLLELIINKIHLKCECFDFDCNNLVISASFLGKKPVALYDCSYGDIQDFSSINIGKSTLFAMTYDTICSIQDFEIYIEISKQPPCSRSSMIIAETCANYTEEFKALKEELCKKWSQEKPEDQITCTASTPLMKNQFYLANDDDEDSEPIGVIELTTRMSFLGKEVTTAFNATSQHQGTSLLLKEGDGIAMYSCQKVEMDSQGKILLDEDAMNKRAPPPKDLKDISQYSNELVATRQMGQAGLGEFRIRDLNDEINKLLREKRHWETQILALGGPDHARTAPRLLDQDGREVPGNRGYKYFGAAKDLPGVRELFATEPPPPPRRTRADLMRDVDADYYGYRDDDDHILEPLEKQAEEEAIAGAVAEWKSNKEHNKEAPDEEDIYPEDPDDKRMEGDDEPSVAAVTSHVAVPSQKEVEEALLRRKKMELLQRFGLEGDDTIT